MAKRGARAIACNVPRYEIMKEELSPGGALDRVDPSMPTLLESAFPYRELSLVNRADRRVRDSAYGAHRWWARRPPALLRAALLAAALPADHSVSSFWESFGQARSFLDGWHVHDPFVGGGSTLVEAARLGASVSGGDVDPLAVRIVRYELDPAGARDIRDSGDALLEHLRVRFGHLYPSSSDERTPLHYFWLHEVTCPECSCSGLLYRDLVLARDRGSVGAVVRDHAMSVFCPEGLSVHHLESADRRELRIRGRRWPLNAGTYANGRYTCPSCGVASTHAALKTGSAPRRLVAVEETVDGGYRRIRRALAIDSGATTRGATWLGEHRNELKLPQGVLSESRKDARPRSFGFDTPTDLFTDRQLAVFGTAFAWLDESNLDESVDAGLRLALSNALGTNNKLCGWATDYGRLAPLFSVRGYSLPALPVELNPLHPDAGRGTIHNCIERVARVADSTGHRNVWVGDSRPQRRRMTWSISASTENVQCRPAQTAPSGAAPLADVCVFDPPYFDYIPYDELSEFFRAWHQLDRLDGDLPTKTTDGDAFGIELATAFRAALAGLKPGRLLAFTYHSTNPDAWTAVATAIDEAKLRITALWPVLSDGHMGHHSSPGNCEWDLLVVCRRVTETVPTPCPIRPEHWSAGVQPLSIGEADDLSMRLAIEIASSRFGRAAKGF